MQTEDKNKSPSERVDKILYRTYREVSEILLKAITWSVMIAAIKYTGEISNSTTLWIGGWVSQTILLAYLYGNIYRLEENTLSRKNMEKIFGRHYWAGIALSVAITGILFVASALFITAVVDAFLTFRPRSK